MTLAASPPTPSPSSLVRVTDSGLADGKYRLLLEGTQVGATYCSLASGSIDQLVQVGAIAGLETIELEHYASAAWSAIDSVGVTVTSPGSGTVLHVAPGVTRSQLQAYVKNMDIDVIEFGDGTYDNLEYVEIDADRTTRPLTLRPAAGATPRFTTNGAYSDGIFAIGLNSFTAYITITGFTFDDIKLGQAGVFGMYSGSHITLTNHTFSNLKRDVSAAVYQAWCIYISMAGGRNNSNLVIDGWTCLAPTVSRDLSCMVIGSSSLSNGPISITNIAMTNYDYGLYVDVAGTVTLDTWTMTNVGDSTPASIRFTAKAINGTYSNIHATSSAVLLNNSTGSMASGGGNSGI